MKQINITTHLNLVIPGRKKDVLSTEKRDKVLKGISLFFIYLFITACAVLAIFPFFYMIIGSFMLEEDVISGKLWPVTGSFFENIHYNYSETLQRFDYFKFVGNTLVVGLSTTAGCLFITIITAFAFSRLHFRGRETLFTIFLATMMIPGEMMVITNYTTMNNLGLIPLDGQTRLQAYLVMILPFLSSVFYIYLLRQNFLQIPNELYFSSKVDGKSDWAYLWKVMVPLASPTLITITILSLIGSWNAYVWPNLVTKNKDYWLISVAMRSSALQLQDPLNPELLVTQSSWTMVASTLTVLPLLILFIIFRKYIMKGTGRAGIKG